MSPTAKELRVAIIGCNFMGKAQVLWAKPLLIVA